MSTYNITTLENDLAAMGHGQNLNQISNLTGLINRAARQVLLDIDAMETKRSTQIAGTVFNGVYDYPVPVDLKGNKIIDLFPQTQRYNNEIWLQAYNQAFDVKKGTAWSSNNFTINVNSGLKTIRINAPFFPPPILLDACNSLTGSSTYTPGGGATTPFIDNINYVSNGGSLEFNLSAGQSVGNMAAVFVAPINLSAHLNQSTLFLWTYLPNPTNVTSITYQWGSDASDYYQVTTSVTQQNTAFQTGWNLLAFPWFGATVVGTPNPANIAYDNVIYNYNSTLQTGVRLNNINSNLGSILNMEYYSKYMFQNASTGAFQETTLATTDLINLDTDSYNIMLYQCGYLAAQQQQGLDALFYDANFMLQQYNNAVAEYKGSYKSEIQVPQSKYYGVKRGGYGTSSGRWWN